MRFWCQHGSMLAPTWAHVGSKKPSWRVLGRFGGLLGRLGGVLARLEKGIEKSYKKQKQKKVSKVGLRRQGGLLG